MAASSLPEEVSFVLCLPSPVAQQRPIHQGPFNPKGRLWGEWDLAGFEFSRFAFGVVHELCCRAVNGV
jgi:hypothetical protein